MDFLNPSFLGSGGSYDYTFNFWNDYLGLSTLVSAKGQGASSGQSSPPPPHSPNAITESLKATLGLEDPATSPCTCGQLLRPSGEECGCQLGPGPTERCFTAAAICHRPYATAEQSQHCGFSPPPFGQAGSGLELYTERRTLLRKASGLAGSRLKPEAKICVFCRNNGAPEEVYGSHVLKTPDGGRVLCPILRAYTCPLCSANGDSAHTIKYCPLSKDQASPHQQPPQPHYQQYQHYHRLLKGGRGITGQRRLKIF
ncbi:nanos homolog 1-like [Ambystoma mexicanum]|uniref:nanos homolog 1-like n=1 Tax=Ambystoma mexicanum TaxID=8296 RepID=UPI0037E7B249